MSTTNGPMKSFKVTDKDGNVYVMIPVDTVAQQEIDGAKNLQFDDDYFTSEVSQDQKTVNVGLNGVPLGVDSDSPLKFKQDNAQGIVLGSDAPFATAIAPEYSASSTYAVGDHCMHLGKYYECSTAISTAEAWNAAHWTLTDVDSTLGAVKNGGALTDDSSILLSNNSVYTLSTAQSTLELSVVVGSNEIPNFAVEITPSVNVTLTVTKTVDGLITALSPSVAGGNTLTSGKKYQVTCVGSCWTLAEFEV